MKNVKSAFQLAWEQKQADKLALKQRQAEWKEKMNGKLTSHPFAVLGAK
jgi:hypothetical protein